MFTYIKLKNFLSFKDVTIDFQNSDKEVKKFIAIYGENGSGKSNIVNSIDLLRRSIESFGRMEHFEEIQKLMDKKEFSHEVIEMFLNSFNISHHINRCRMVDCEENTTVEYGFRIGNNKGYYVLSFGERFSYEKLYYFTGKQRGILFEIKNTKDKNELFFSNKLFLSNEVEKDIRNEINKYWGKHTFLGILENEIEKKNESYIKENYLSHIFEVLEMFNDISAYCKMTPHYKSRHYSDKPNNVLGDLSKGKIKAVKEAQLDCSERILKDFFTQAYADIKDVFYKKSHESDEIEYKLFFKKMIGGKIRTIDIERESAGTQHILDVIRSLLGAFCGVTVVYDEIDNGIHDLLLKNIILSMMDEITGQLIITTHNTFLLESIDIKSAFVITVDYLGNKEVKCLNKYPRIQGTNNPRNMYLKGLFGGVPIVDIVDYDEIIDELQETNHFIGGE
ncbi:MAG: ATP-binding protein [Lachnospiraceae bacterium]|nr:ATP-binding protein [Lachnospiraceae bacterium]